jgi:N-glycosidase YbiA
MKKASFFGLLMVSIVWIVKADMIQELTGLTEAITDLNDALVSGAAPSVDGEPSRKIPTHPPQAEQLSFRLIRVVPMAFDKNTGQWSILLGHDPQEYWTDFSNAFRRGTTTEALPRAARKILANQTHGEYDVSMEPAVVEETQDNDVVYFVPVRFISGRELYTKARNPEKDDFVWIPENAFAVSGDISRPHNKRPTNVSRGVKNMLKYYLPEVTAQLSGGAPQPVGNNSWEHIPGAIYFYESSKPFYELTNFYLEPVVIGGIRWPTTEHYYQAQKFTSSALQKKVRDKVTAREAFNFAREHKNQVRSDWQQINLDVMLNALRAKFAPGSPLGIMLQHTGDAILVEDAGSNDDFFGAGANYRGKNHLGQLLMHVRDELNAGMQMPYRAHDPAWYK